MHICKPNLPYCGAKGNHTTLLCNVQILISRPAEFWVHWCFTQEENSTVRPFTGNRPNQAFRSLVSSLALSLDFVRLVLAPI